MSVYHENEIEISRNLGADLLFIPYEDAAVSAAKRLAEDMNPAGFSH